MIIWHLLQFKNFPRFGLSMRFFWNCNFNTRFYGAIITGVRPTLHSIHEVRFYNLLNLVKVLISVSEKWQYTWNAHEKCVWRTRLCDFCLVETPYICITIWIRLQATLKLIYCTNRPFLSNTSLISHKLKDGVLKMNLILSCSVIIMNESLFRYSLISRITYFPAKVFLLALESQDRIAGLIWMWLIKVILAHPTLAPKLCAEPTQFQSSIIFHDSIHVWEIII